MLRGADTERTMADVLKEHGPILERQRLEDLCTARGLKRDTFYVHLTYSPVIERYAQGVYGLAAPLFRQAWPSRWQRGVPNRSSSGITAGMMTEELESATDSPSRCCRMALSASLPESANTFRGDSLLKLPAR